MTRSIISIRPYLVVAFCGAFLAGCGSVSVPGTDLLSPNSNEVDRTPTQNRPQPDSRGVITYPTYQVAVASSGDTVTTVANRLGLDPQTLATANGLPLTAPLRPGELVILTSRVSATPTNADGSVDVATLAGTALDRASGTSTSAPPAGTLSGPEPVRHSVKRGENAYTVARLYDVSVKSLSDWNGLDANLTVREGQVLLIPVAAGSAAGAGETSLPGSGTPSPEPPSSSQPQPSEDLPSIAESNATTAAAGSAVGAAVPAQTAASDNTVFTQPVSGTIVRAFKPGTNNGLDYRASAGSPVRAAESGTVAVVTRNTDQIAIVVVNHGDGLLTIYANVDDIKVSKGAKVARGQSLAAVPAGDGNNFHFEVRRNNEAVDPLDYLAN